MNRVLIANRGEIARRVIRTARRMGIETVAVYSDVDTPSLHVSEADVAIRLPGASPRSTYLDIDRVVKAAVDAGADCVHPGYGFLSENALFAERCIDAGIAFIGPTPAAIRLLGSKTAARALAIANDVPVNPGTTSAIESIDEARAAAQEIGFPVLLKAAAGGGGKGMRVVRDADQLEEGIRAARGEALTAFNDESIFLERYIDAPRHIELQALADHHGNVAILGERECSIQRRHQKVVEESPSPVVTDEMRSVIFNAAERLVKAAGYTNAGTLEFLMDTNGRFAFLEVNTRLQVEHPVTEMTTGLDLVEWQFRIADGERLPFTTPQVKRYGHAIECRICAEDVYDRFLPSVGVVHEVSEPHGEHVRVDSALYDGMPVTLYYDPMLSKLIVWGESREIAIEGMRRALDAYHVAGVPTTIPFCRFVMNDETFVDGGYTTRFVDERWLPAADSRRQELLVMAASAATAAHIAIEGRMTSNHGRAHS